MAHDRARFDRKADQCAGLELLKARDRLQIEFRRSGHQVHHLAARHAGRAAGARQLSDQFDPHERIGVGIGVRQYFERQRVKRVSGENGRGFVKGFVHGRLAAPHVVIVHARQIVVDEAIDVNAFHRDAHAQRARSINVEQIGRSADEKRTQPLSAADRGMAHGFEQTEARIVRQRQ